MKQTISVQIDVDKIEKHRIFKGKKGRYLNCIIMLNDEKDQYDQNGMIVQSVSKEEYEKGVQGPILGNVKILNQQKQEDRSEPNFDNLDDDLPF